MPAEPTPAQIESRQKVAEFLKSAPRKIRGLGENIKSAWFGRPDEELQGWIERGKAFEEIEGSKGYQMIVRSVEKEILWAQEQLEVGKLDVTELRMYLRALRFMQDYIVTVRRNADISGNVLAGRDGAIGRDSFVRPVNPGERY